MYFYYGFNPYIRYPFIRQRRPLREFPGFGGKRGGFITPVALPGILPISIAI